MYKLILVLLLSTINIQAATTNINAAARPNIKFNTNYNTYYDNFHEEDEENCIDNVNDNYINPQTDELYLEDEHISQDDYTDMKDACKVGN